MNKKIIGGGVVMGFLVLALMFPKSGQAFWPFDILFGKGEVKGEQTEIGKNTGVVKPNTKPISTTPDMRPSTYPSKPTTTTPTPVVVEDDLADTEARLDNAWKKRLITDAQRLELKTRINNIRVQRETLRKMQENLIAWLKSQKIDPKKWDVPTTTPTGNISPTVTARPSMYVVDPVKPTAFPTKRPTMYGTDPVKPKSN